MVNKSSSSDINHLIFETCLLVLGSAESGTKEYDASWRKGKVLRDGFGRFAETGARVEEFVSQRASDITIPGGSAISSILSAAWEKVPDTVKKLIKQVYDQCRSLLGAEIEGIEDEEPEISGDEEEEDMEETVKRQKALEEVVENKSGIRTNKSEKDAAIKKLALTSIPVATVLALGIGKKKLAAEVADKTLGDIAIGGISAGGTSLVTQEELEKRDVDNLWLEGSASAVSGIVAGSLAQSGIKSLRKKIDEAGGPLNLFKSPFRKAQDEIGKKASKRVKTDGPTKVDTYVMTRGAQKDYNWRKYGEEVSNISATPNMKDIDKLKNLIQSDSPSVVLSKEGNKLILVVTGQLTKQKDLRGRTIRNSVAWHIENPSEKEYAQIKKLASDAVRGKLDVTDGATRSQASTDIWDVSDNVLLDKKAGSPQLKVKGKPKPKKGRAAKDSPERREELASEIESVDLSDDFTAVVTKNKAKGGLKGKANRAISALIDSENWSDL